MAHITLPEFEEYDFSNSGEGASNTRKTGQLGEIFKLMAIDEKVYFATDGMVQGYLLNETELPYSVKEAIALLVSKENGCKMCVDVHKSIAKMLGMTEEQVNQVLLGIDAMDVSDNEKALLSFCLRASGKDNYKILKSDIEAIKSLGYSDV